MQIFKLVLLFTFSVLLVASPLRVYLDLNDDVAKISLLEEENKNQDNLKFQFNLDFPSKTFWNHNSDYFNSKLPISIHLNKGTLSVSLNPAVPPPRSA